MIPRLSRRQLLHATVGAAVTATAGSALAADPPPATAVAAPPVPTPTPTPIGPVPDSYSVTPNRYWNSIGPLVKLPQKVPLIQVADRPVQLETPRHYFLTALTPSAAFFVRWHLGLHPRAVDLHTWRLRVDGKVSRPLALSYAELLRDFHPVTVAAVNQCTGNSRSRFAPRVPGSQWGNGGMGCAQWTGVRLRDLLARAGVQAGALALQLSALDRGGGPEGSPAARYVKSLDLKADVTALDDALLAYAQNGEPLPLLNGFPLRLVVPGYFSTYWVKALEALTLIDRPDENYWTKVAYRVPARPRGNITPEEFQKGDVVMQPVTRMPVRSFLITPDGESKLPVGFPVTLRGIAFSGFDRIVRVEVSTDDGASWQPAQLGEDLGRYAFRPFTARFVPERPGPATLCVRATDGKGNTQSDAALWNPGGYQWNRIERQEVVIGPAD